MSCICKQKYLEAYDHFEKLQNAFYDIMSDAYGEEIADLLFFPDDEEMLENSEVASPDVVLEAKRLAEYEFLVLKTAMEILERAVNKEDQLG